MEPTTNFITFYWFGCIICFLLCYYILIEINIQTPFYGLSFLMSCIFSLTSWVGVLVLLVFVFKYKI